MIVKKTDKTNILNCNLIRAQYLCPINLALFFLILHMSAFAQQPENPLTECFATLATNTRLSLVLEKVALGNAKETTFRMYTLSEHASSEEKEAILAWGDAREQCYQQNRYFRDSLNPELAAVLDEYFAATQRLIAELYDGALSFGEFNKRRVELYENAARREDEVIHGIGTQVTQQDLEIADAACRMEVQRTAAQAQQRPYYAPGTGQFRELLEAFGSEIVTQRQIDGLYMTCMGSKGWIMHPDPNKGWCYERCED